MSDTNMAALVGYTGAAVFLICAVGLAILVWLEVRDERRWDSHAANVDAMSRRPMDDAPPETWAAWEAEYGEFISRRNRPSNWGRS